MTLFIFEGPRGAGKTTLFEGCNLEFRLPIWNRPEDVETFKLKMELIERKRVYWEFCKSEIAILNAINWYKNDMLTDRHPAISEYAFRLLHDIPRDFVLRLQPGSAIIYVHRELDTPEALVYETIMGGLDTKFPMLRINTGRGTIKSNTELVKKFILTWSGVHGRRDYG